MNNKPQFIPIDPKQDKIDLIQKYQSDTGTVLYPAQDAMALINLIVYYANLVKAQFNDAACLNLAQFSRYPIVDFLGEYKNCKRLAASSGEDILKITLNTTFSYDIVINKGFQVKSSDGEHIFETIEDLTIPAGDTVGTVQIQSQVQTDEVNKYSAGEINEVISSAYSYIENVSNLNGVSGGSAEETDEHYIDRILIAPEGYSVAGPAGAYIYFTKSAHASIIDVGVETPDENISIDINGTTLEMTTNEDSNAIIGAEADYITEKAVITLKQALQTGSVITVKIPHPYKVNIYVLTETGTASQVILNKVDEILKPVRPLNDYLNIRSATVEEFIISGQVYMTLDADEDFVKENVNTYLTNYINSIKNKLNHDVVLHKIITEVCKIDGVYDFNLTTPENILTASKSVTYNGTIGNLTYIRTEREA